MNTPGAHSARATRALQKLVETDPAMGALSLWCVHRDAAPEHGWGLIEKEAGDYDLVTVTYEIAPAYTDGRVIYYGSAFDAWTLDEQMAVCAHEILHIALQHIPRAQRLRERFGPRYSARLFNIATDALINETLSRTGYRLPSPRVVLADLLVQSGIELEAAKVLEEWDVEKLYAEILDASETDPSRKAWLNQLVRDVHADVFEGAHLTTEEHLQSAEWSQRLERALRAGSAAGRGIGTLGSRLGDIPKTKTPWEVLLRRMIAKAVTVQPSYSFARPTNRWLALDAEAVRTNAPAPGFEPGISRTEKKQGRVVVCVDVSGSISPPLLTRFAGEIDGISRKTGAEIVLILFDHGIQLEQRLAQATLKQELRSLRFQAGGGTSFVEPVAKALEYDPSIIVVLTDLMGPFGPAPVKTPVIWASCGQSLITAPFGKTIFLKS